MAVIKIADAEGEVKDGWYINSFLRWKGFYDSIPVLAAEIDASCEAAVSNYRLKGPNSITLGARLKAFRGNGKQTFRGLIFNGLKTAQIGGDSFMEIIYDDSDEVENLIQLPSENIKVRSRNGVITGYKEVDGDARWKPEGILHFAFNPCGASTHGTSMI